jgi:hypothetical protein
MRLTWDRTPVNSLKRPKSSLRATGDTQSRPGAAIALVTAAAEERPGRRCAHSAVEIAVLASVCYRTVHVARTYWMVVFRRWCK